VDCTDWSLKELTSSNDALFEAMRECIEKVANAWIIEGIDWWKSANSLERVYKKMPNNIGDLLNVSSSISASI
jgi:hypothetical protein